MSFPSVYIVTHRTCFYIQISMRFHITFMYYKFTFIVNLYIAAWVDHSNPIHTQQKTNFNLQLYITNSLFFNFWANNLSARVCDHLFLGLIFVSECVFICLFFTNNYLSQKKFKFRQKQNRFSSAAQCFLLSFALIIVHIYKQTTQ